jgi:hypothetical protein
MFISAGQKFFLKKRCYSLTEVLVALVVLAVGVLPIFTIYSKNTEDLSSQREKMITLYITKRIMETVRQFNANSPDNFDVLESKFNLTNQKVVDNFTAGEFFYYFEDLHNPHGFTDEVGISQRRYPVLYDFLHLYRYDVAVSPFTYQYAYDNYYGTGTYKVKLKEVKVTVTDPHKKKFTYQMLLTRTRK